MWLPVVHGKYTYVTTLGLFLTQLQRNSEKDVKRVPAITPSEGAFQSACASAQLPVKPFPYE